MLQMAIIADDLTGALDTGIKFSKMGIRTQILTDYQFCLDDVDSDIEVLVIDTETRHLHESEAYARVYKSVKLCSKLGVRHYYKKTDSALRGHIGSELAALYDVTGHPVAFIPALPRENRITKEGVHYINGIPVAQSIFGQDSLNPVRHSEIIQILQEETTLSAESFTKDDRAYASDKQIRIYDAASSEDLTDIGTNLKMQDFLTVTAGCSGFAEVLSDLLPFSRSPAEVIPQTDKLIVICGSINEVSRNQVEYAERLGCRRISLTQEQKMDKKYLQTEAGDNFLKRLEKMCSENQILILDVFSEDTVEDSRQYAISHGINPDEIADRIAFRLAELGRYILSLEKDTSLLAIGGDTLYALIQNMDLPLLKPVCEPVSGTVSMYVQTHGHHYPLISKSGGFGREDVIMDIANLVLISPSK